MCEWLSTSSTTSTTTAANLPPFYQIKLPPPLSIHSPTESFLPHQHVHHHRAHVDNDDDEEMDVMTSPPPLLSASTSSTSSSPASSPPPRKGSIASLLNSIGELQKLDQEEWSTNYQTHFMLQQQQQQQQQQRMIIDESDNDVDAEPVKLPSPSSTSYYRHNHHRQQQQQQHHHKKGLRLFSQHVCDILQQRGRTTYNQLVQQLIQELNENDTLHDPKNIRRRVYDALNVLMAINFISKDKKEIRWLGADGDEEEQVEEAAVVDDHSRRRSSSSSIASIESNPNKCDESVDDISDTDDDDDEEENDMMLERDLLWEEQRYQDLTRKIDLKRKEIQGQMQQQKYCQHGLPDPTTFAT